MESIYVTSSADNDGVYRLMLELGPDEVVPLDAEQAKLWVEYVISVMTAADHDAAVLMQMSALGMAPRGAASIVSRLRRERFPSMPVSPISGLVLEPAVKSPDGPAPKDTIPQRLVGYVVLKHKDKEAGYWSREDCADHVLGVLIGHANTALDTAYLTELQGDIGLDRARAGAVIAELGTRRGLPRVVVDDEKTDEKT